MSYRAPDPQLLMLRAYEVEFERAVDALELTHHQANALYPELPESVVFHQDFFAERDESWDEDDDAAIRMVGERDVQAKIDVWKKTLDRMAAGDIPSDEDARAEYEDAMERAAERRAGC